MVIFPNAKINIGLSVVEKRADGFHNIESVFYPINTLYDVLEIVEADELKFTSSGIEIPGKIESNLCLQAYRLIKEDHDIPNVHIHLLKAIPIGAGLGGGSSDAAFTLKLLNEKFELHLSEEELINYARKLGSDCAFFIRNKPVYAYGKGDEFSEIGIDLSAYEVKIEYPNIHVGTAEAYSGILPKPSLFELKKLDSLPINKWKELVVNDFETSIFPNHLSIKELKKKFYEDGAVYASMTGSGSAVFGIFNKD